MKIFSISLDIREMQIKTTIGYHFISTRMAKISMTVENINKNMNIGRAYISGKIVKWYNTLKNYLSASYRVKHLINTYRVKHTTLNLVISLLGIHAKDLKVYLQKRLVQESL